MTVKPLIGITTSELRPGDLATLRRHGEPPHPEMALGITYVRAIEAAGGLAVVMPPVAAADLSSLLRRVDAVLLAGGPDLAPGAYAALPHPELGPTEPRLDRFEYEVAQESLRLGLPILGICRGGQALNVACGGTLHQHLPDIAGEAVVHRQSEDARRSIHTVDVAPDSRLARVLGGTRLAVNSFHHQAVDRLGAGLRACAWAADGTIEAIEDPERPLVLGVQWHAETLVGRREQLALFAALVDFAAGTGEVQRAA